MIEEDMKWWLRVAYKQAILSPDDSTQNGAVVLNKHGSPIGWGYNGFTDGFKPSEDHLGRPLKYSYIEHAERNAIYSIFMKPHYSLLADYKPHTLVAAWAACSDCARAIVQSGIKVLIRHKRADNDRWGDSISHGDNILRQGGVEIVEVEGNLGGCSPVLFNGEWIVP